jgi:hypothetical protein
VRALFQVLPRATSVLGVADFLRGRVAPGLRLLKSGDRRAPLFVERQELFRHRLKPAPFQPPVKGVRMLANPFDVVHGGFLYRPGASSSLETSQDADARHKAEHGGVQ